MSAHWSPQYPQPRYAIEAFLADVSVRSPQKLSILIIKLCVYRIEVSKVTCNLYFEKRVATVQKLQMIDIRPRSSETFMETDG